MRGVATTLHPEYQYLDLMRETLERGDQQVDKDHGIRTYSAFGAQMRFDLSRGFPLLTTKRVYWKGVVHELYWFLSGQTNIKYLVDNDVHIWDDYPYKIYLEKAQREGLPEMTKEEFVALVKSDNEFARDYGELPHIYGESWRHWPAGDGRIVDQLQFVVDELTRDPDAHNALVTSWNPPYLYTMAPANEGARFPICHNLYQVNVKQGKVCLQLYQRSADMFLGVPFNIASYALLTHILAHILKREAGEFVHTFGDYHMYDTHREQVKEQLAREPKAFPKVSFTKDFKTLDDFRPEYVLLEGYEPHPTIKADLVVAGGFSKNLHAQTV